MDKNIKDKAVSVLPYIAVAGVAIVGIYALTKLVKTIDSSFDDLDLDFGNDPVLKNGFK